MASLLAVQKVMQPSAVSLGRCLWSPKGVERERAQRVERMRSYMTSKGMVPVRQEE